jgi:hypothetical protein
VFKFQKLFQGYIFCFLGDSFGRCIFEQYASETDLKKKRSVIRLAQHTVHCTVCYVEVVWILYMHVSVCIHESISITSIRPKIYMIGLVL